MTLEELKIELAAILGEEEAPHANWESVEFLSEQTYLRLNEFPREDVIGYLGGFVRRRLDKRFGEQQRQWLRSYLRAS